MKTTPAQSRALAAITELAARHGATVEADTYRGDLFCTVSRPDKALLLVVRPDGTAVR